MEVLEKGQTYGYIMHVCPCHELRVYVALYEYDKDEDIEYPLRWMDLWRWSKVMVVYIVWRLANSLQK